MSFCCLLCVLCLYSGGHWYWRFTIYSGFFFVLFFSLKFLPSPPQTNSFPPNEPLLRLISGADLFLGEADTHSAPASVIQTHRKTRAGRRQQSRCLSSGGGGVSLNNPVQPHSFLPACLRDLNSDSWLIATAKVWGCVCCSLTWLRFQKPKPSTVPPLARATLLFSDCIFVGPASIPSRLVAHSIVFPSNTGQANVT